MPRKWRSALGKIFLREDVTKTIHKIELSLGIAGVAENAQCHGRLVLRQSGRWNGKRSLLEEVIKNEEVAITITTFQTISDRNLNSKP